MPDPLPARRATAGLGLTLALAVGLSGCSGDDAPSARPSPNLSPTTSLDTSPSSPTANESLSYSVRVQGSDRGTGIRFFLPGSVRGPVRSTRPGQGGIDVQSREYASAEDGVRLSVSVLTTPSDPTQVRETVRAQYLPFLVVDTVRAQGATDAGVVSNRRLQGFPYTAFDSQLTFVREGRRAVWFTRAIELPRTVVVAQAVAYVPVREDAVDRVRSEFRQLTDGLTIPS